MKIVAFTLVATQASALLLGKNSTAKVTGQVHLAAKKNVAKTNQTPIVDPIDKRREEREADQAHQEAVDKADGGQEIEPMNGSCSHNTMRCIYVHVLPRDYCMVTGQPPWCVQYANEPACLMVENYDRYIEAKSDTIAMSKTCEQRLETSCKIDHHESGYDTNKFDYRDFGRWLLGGRGDSAKGDHNAIQCEGTRGWGQPRYLDPENPGELPSCKSNQAASVCESHSGHRQDLKCPSCGDRSGQDGGASADNDVTGGMR